MDNFPMPNFLALHVQHPFGEVKSTTSSGDKAADIWVGGIALFPTSKAGGISREGEGILN